MASMVDNYNLGWVELSCLCFKHHKVYSFSHFSHSSSCLNHAFQTLKSQCLMVWIIHKSFFGWLAANVSLLNPRVWRLNHHVSCSDHHASKGQNSPFDGPNSIFDGKNSIFDGENSTKSSRPVLFQGPRSLPRCGPTNARRQREQHGEDARHARRAAQGLGACKEWNATAKAAWPFRRWFLVLENGWT